MVGEIILIAFYGVLLVGGLVIFTIAKKYNPESKLRK